MLPISHEGRNGGRWLRVQPRRYNSARILHNPVQNMYFSKFPLTTYKDSPSDAEVVSHQLMLRAGLIKRLATGLYDWLPLGMRVLHRVERIIREEMDRAGALELRMPAVQPAELWQESSRWEAYGPELLRFKDRHDRDYCLGPTHEEVITAIARDELKSYRQLPVNYYQIQTKFRDEIRPRFGVMRSREFIMKDAYSFHIDTESLAQTYQLMRDTYRRIFERFQLEFRIVQADTGAIGGSRSEEFQVLAASGEDAIAYCDADDFAANVEVVALPAGTQAAPAPTAALTLVETPGVGTIDALAGFLDCAPAQCLKLLLVEGKEHAAVGLLLRGDHELNAVKAGRLPEVALPLRLLDASTVVAATGAPPGFVGPIGLDVPLYADHAAAALADFVCGANRKDHHYTGVNWGRDLPAPRFVDLRNAVEGDPSPAGGGTLKIARGIEVGQIFQLGQKYSGSMDATVLAADGQPRVMEMGCYGIGVTRVVAAAIEQNHDERGIIWPEALAPFDIVMIPINFDKSAVVAQRSETLYAELQAAGFAVLFDDRPQRPGFKFADADLLGIPHRIVLSDKTLENGQVEYKQRRDAEAQLVALDGIVSWLRDR
jgi:prolyl-tRNA synthetase